MRGALAHHLLLLHLLLLHGCSSDERRTVHVVTKRGIVSGTVHRTPVGTEYYRFGGLPYARHRRFQQPRLLSKLGLRVFDATKKQPPCPQISKGEVIGNEECLTVSIASPKVDPEDNQSFPVLAIVNGENFVSDVLDEFDPSLWIEERLTIVKIQYRLGVLGFLSTDDSSGGNYGLHDVTVALVWIKETIAYFGGDPDRVTLLGMGSSGSVIVYDLYSSVATEGLFNKAVCTANPPVGIMNHNPSLDHVFRRIAVEMQCPETTSLIFATSCFRVKSPRDIVTATQTTQERLGNEGQFWSWITPSREENRQGFSILSKDPIDLLFMRKETPVPLIIMWAREEGTSLLKEFYDSFLRDQLKDAKRNPRNFSLSLLSLWANLTGHHSWIESDQLTYLFHEVFFKDVEFHNIASYLEALNSFLTTILWRVPLVSMAKHLSRFQVPVRIGIIQYPRMLFRFDDVILEGTTSLAAVRSLFDPKHDGQYKTFFRWKKQLVRVLSVVCSRIWPTFTDGNPVYLSIGSQLLVKQYEEASTTTSSNAGVYQTATWTLLVLLFATIAILLLCLLCFRGKSKVRAEGKKEDGV